MAYSHRALFLSAKPMTEQILVLALQTKAHHVIERTTHLIELVPAKKLDWKPAAKGVYSDLGHILGHLLDCMAGLCSVFHRAFPKELAELSTRKELPVNHSCTPQEALHRFAEYAGYIDRGFALCTDMDLSRTLPSAFRPQGSPMLSLLLNNLEHLISHRYQLFFYLKLSGIAVGTADIYHFEKASSL